MNLNLRVPVADGDLRLVYCRLGQLPGQFLEFVDQFPGRFVEPARLVLEVSLEDFLQLGVGRPPPAARPDDPRRILALAVGYVGENSGRMDYAAYRRAGLPVSSAAVESLIKQFNQRVKGTEKFWGRGGAEAILQCRAAYLSDDGRAEEFYARRPEARPSAETAASWLHERLCTPAGARPRWCSIY